ncbi:MAG: PHB depolymerase family esterase [Candidatus Rokuibacteriota bacterium]
MRGLLAALAVVAQVTAGSPAQAGSFTSGVHEGRAYRLYVPATAASTLVIALHGCWQTPDDFARGTRLNEAADRRGLVIVYPAQGRAAHPYRCWNWYEAGSHTAARGETAEILALARHIASEHGLGDRRAVVLGFSAGGFMAVNLVCAAPSLVSGVGVLAGGAYRCGVGAEGAIQCMRGRGGDGAAAAQACLDVTGARTLPVRASLWQGAVDRVVNAANLSALETMFARAVGMVSSATESQPGAVTSVHRDGRGRPVVETWLIRNMGHAWSGGDPRGRHTYPAGPRATDRMLDFLLGPAPR